MKQKFTMPTGEIVEKDFPIFKTPFNHDTNFESDRTGTLCREESMTKQEFRDEVDINTIINRFLKTGEPPPMPLPEHFVDITSRLSFKEISEELAAANAAFYKLPARIREQSNNSPSTWADNVAKAIRKRDGEALQELGLSIDVRAPEEPDQPATPSGGTPAPEPQKGAPSAPKGA